MMNRTVSLSKRSWNLASAAFALCLAGAMFASNALAAKLQSRTQNGFTATAALVNDPDWESKWSAVPPVVPNFVLARRITADEPATLLIFFSNPSRDQENIQVTCDMEIRDSKREIVARIDRSVCLAYLPSGEEADVFLFPEMELTEDHGSASGPLLMSIGVTDEVRNERIDLELEIEVEKGGR